MRHTLPLECFCISFCSEENKFLFVTLVQLLIIFQQGCRLLLHWYISSQIPSLVWGKAVVVYFPLWI